MPKTTLTNFNHYARDINSQHGEDGIIEEILSRIDACRAHGPRHCVEFGAWDGKHLSNTYNLIANKGYGAVLIEADPEKYKTLCENIPQESVVKLNELVAFEGRNTLDEILSRTDIPNDFDFLSIDIDGNDYFMLKSLQKYRPALICIEFNPTIPNEVDYVQPPDPRIKRGASARAIMSLASGMGYAVVASTYCNLFLLDRKYLSAVGLESEPLLQDVRNDSGTRVFVFSGYDGAILLSGPVNMPWHGLDLSDASFQVLPSLLQRFPDDYSGLQRLGFRLLRAILRHGGLYRLIRRKLGI